MIDGIENDVIVADYEVFRVRRRSARSRRTGGSFDFHVVERPDCVQIIALTPADEVILVEQFRYGSASVELEFPAGVVATGEEPWETALRELEEETGYRAGRHEPIGAVLADPALHTNTVGVIAAYDCARTGQPSLDASEDLSVRVVARADIGRMIAGGQIRHGLAIAAWHLFACR